MPPISLVLTVAMAMHAIVCSICRHHHAHVAPFPSCMTTISSVARLHVLASVHVAQLGHIYVLALPTGVSLVEPTPCASARGYERRRDGWMRGEGYYKIAVTREDGRDDKMLK
jgi:hypothetical protein